MAHMLWQNDCLRESDFHFLCWPFQNLQIARWFEIKSPMSEFLALETHAWAASSPCNAWNKIMQGRFEKTAFSIPVGRRLPGDVLPQKYQPIWQLFLKCCTNLCQIQGGNLSENHTPHLLGVGKIVGIVSGCGSKWTHWEEKRFKGQSWGRWGGI